MLKCFVPVLGMILAVPAWPASYYTARLDDPKAVYLTPDAFGLRGDGVADDSDAIQKAVDKALESASQGIVFVPEGRYRLTRTINVWASWQPAFRRLNRLAQGQIELLRLGFLRFRRAGLDSRIFPSPARDVRLTGASLWEQSRNTPAP